MPSPGAIPVMASPPITGPGASSFMEQDPAVYESVAGLEVNVIGANVPVNPVTNTGNLPTMSPDVDFWGPCDRIVETQQQNGQPAWSGDGKIPPIQANSQAMGQMTGAEFAALDKPSLQRKQWTNYHDGWLAAGTIPQDLGGHSTVSRYVTNPSQQLMDQPGYSSGAVSVTRSIPGPLVATLPEQANPSAAGGFLDNTAY